LLWLTIFVFSSPPPNPSNPERQKDELQSDDKESITIANPQFKANSKKNPNIPGSPTRSSPRLQAKNALPPSYDDQFEEFFVLN
jgi:hypothetical protein